MGARAAEDRPGHPAALMPQSGAAAPPGSSARPDPQGCSGPRIGAASTGCSAFRPSPWRWILPACGPGVLASLRARSCAHGRPWLRWLRSPIPQATELPPSAVRRWFRHEPPVPPPISAASHDPAAVDRRARCPRSPWALIGAGPCLLIRNQPPAGGGMPSACRVVVPRIPLLAGQGPESLSNLPRALIKTCYRLVLHKGEF